VSDILTFPDRRESVAADAFHTKLIKLINDDEELSLSTLVGILEMVKADLLDAMPRSDV